MAQRVLRETEDPRYSQVSSVQSTSQLTQRETFISAIETIRGSEKSIRPASSRRLRATVRQVSQAITAPRPWLPFRRRASLLTLREAFLSQNTITTVFGESPAASSPRLQETGLPAMQAMVVRLRVLRLVIRSASRSTR